MSNNSTPFHYFLFSKAFDCTIPENECAVDDFVEADLYKVRFNWFYIFFCGIYKDINNLLIIYIYVSKYVNNIIEYMYIIHSYYWQYFNIINFSGRYCPGMHLWGGVHLYLGGRDLSQRSVQHHDRHLCRSVCYAGSTKFLHANSIIFYHECLQQ